MVENILGFALKDIINVDIEELLFMSYIDAMLSYNKSKKEWIDGDQYVWVCYDTFLKAYLCIGRSKRSFREKIQRLCTKGYIQIAVVRKGGTYSYFAKGIKFPKRY